MLKVFVRCRPHRIFGLWQTEFITRAQVEAVASDVDGVYLLHSFDPANPDQPFDHAWDYLGHSGAHRVPVYESKAEEQRGIRTIKRWVMCGGILARYEAHLKYKGARLTRAWLKAKRTIILARVWPERGRDFERYLKDTYKDTRSLCPYCNPAARRFAFDPALDVPTPKR